ncbi:MAG: NAD(P)/FAD-dependent oxidoreductase [Candidatus Micrarchaeota archaeon]
MDKKAVVIGASAVGSITARELANRGIEVDLLEEDSRVGKFGKCGGIFSKHGMDCTGVNYKDLVLNEIKGARIVSGQEELKVRTPHTQAVVLSRQAFDERAADEAVSAGVNLHLNSRVRNFEVDGRAIELVNGKSNVGGGGVVKSNSSGKGHLSAITTDGVSYSGNVVIGCDGNSSITARKLAFPEIALSDMVISYQAEFAKADVPEPDMVDLYLDHSAYKNFFMWTIPISKEKIRVGVATTEIKEIEKAKAAAFKEPYIAGMLEKSYKTFEFYHMIPLRYRKKTQMKMGDAGYALLVGDAAGQVKATSGGGVNFGAKCAKTAARETAKYLLEGGNMNYENAWRKEHGGVLKMHYLLHRAYRLFPDWLTEFSLGAVKRLGMRRLLESKGDMDYVFRL